MKRFTQYIQELHSQINPYLQRDVPDICPPYDQQSVMTDNDTVNVDFIYNDKKYSYSIKYNELKFGTSENIHWHVKKHDGDLTFDIHAQKSGTGRYNATIINMMVDVIKNDKKIDEITPHCSILYGGDRNKILNIDIRNI